MGEQCVTKQQYIVEVGHNNEDSIPGPPALGLERGFLIRCVTTGSRTESVVVVALIVSVEID